MLVATDAAGEGINLQRAHLMVNYDLPWNPNRIEQRFGRIHRIGQTEVCHMWNLVAEDTREGQVFQRLLEKLDEQRQALGGQVFDVLGEAFADMPLRDLLIEAVRYGERPDVRDRLNEVVDATVGNALSEVVQERALVSDLMTAADVEQIREEIDRAQAKRLQPHFIHSFFLEAFTLLGGEPGTGARPLRDHARPGRVQAARPPIGTGAPVPRRYERVTFDSDLVLWTESRGRSTSRRVTRCLTSPSTWLSSGSAASCSKARSSSTTAIRETCPVRSSTWSRLPTGWRARTATGAPCPSDSSLSG